MLKALFLFEEEVFGFLVYDSHFLLLNLLLQSVCNLGMWCISVQQLEPMIIDDRADLIVTAVVYALDNPFGSLSTTFEAAQVILHT